MIHRVGRLLLSVSLLGMSSWATADEEVLTKKDEDRRDLTLLRRLTENTFIHEASRITYTIPKGWKEIRPQRLTRNLEPRTSTAMGIELAERDVVATLLWTPLNKGAKFAELVREDPLAGEYGEEYETLKTVYGKENVTLPEKKTYSGRSVYKVAVRGGPDRGEKYDGALYLFEVGSDDNRWLIRVRVSFPKSKEPSRLNEQYAEAVLAGYANIPVVNPKDDAPKTPELPKPPEIPK